VQFTFLGTSAANAYPEAFCRCPHCERARELGGPSLRKRSSALLNDDLLIDLGPDIHSAATHLGRPLTNVRTCLQTHAHADHLDASHLLSRSPEYGVTGAPRLHWYASEATARAAAKLLERDCAPLGLLHPATGERLNLAIHCVRAFETFDCGSYRVTALPANHDPAVEPLLYAIQSEGRCLFYGADTAALSEEVWRTFHRLGLRFDLMVLDHTYGPDEAASDHLNARELIAHVARMRAEGLLAPGGRVLASHIAHQGNPPHPELAAWAVERGYEVAYDGLTVEL
jgi:phosphoribosyl 1,2-cyclic phosphodiesterase